MDAMLVQVKPGVRNFIVIGIMAVLFILLIKVIFNKYYVKGLSETVNAL